MLGLLTISLKKMGDLLSASQNDTCIMSWLGSRKRYYDPFVCEIKNNCLVDVQPGQTNFYTDFSFSLWYYLILFWFIILVMLTMNITWSMTIVSNTIHYFLLIIIIYTEKKNAIICTDYKYKRQ